VARHFQGSMAAPEIGLDPTTLTPTVNRAADMAAKHVQGRAIDPQLASDTIGRTKAEFEAEGLPVPTSGLISGDTGLLGLEKDQRTKLSTGTIAESHKATPEVKAKYSFGERDTALRDSAVENVASTRGDGKPEAFVQRAEEVGDAQIDFAQRRADRAQGEQQGAMIARDAPARELRAYEGEGPAASARIDRNYTDIRRTEREANRALYRAPELTGTDVPTEPLLETVDRLRALDNPTAPLDPIVRKYTDRFRRPEVDPETGKVTRPGYDAEQIPMQQVMDLRQEIERDIKRSLHEGGNVEQLRQLKDAAARYVDDLAEQGNDSARAATQNYAERIRPNFREGAGGRLDARMKSDSLGHNLREDTTAKNFLIDREGTESLMRIGRLHNENPGQMAADARVWLLDELARKNIIQQRKLPDPDPRMPVGDTVSNINADELIRWRNQNDGRIGAVPGMRGIVDGMIRDAQRGQQTVAQRTVAAKTAATEAKDKAAEVKAGPIGMVSGKAPDKGVAAVFSSDNPEKAMTELKASLGKDISGKPSKAAAGLKAAVAEHFVAKVSNINPAAVSEGSQTIGFAQLTKEFKKHEKTLVAAGYTPEDMNALRRAHKLLEPLGKRQVQATTGSITAESNEQAWRAVEAGMKLTYGMLKGGGIMRSLKLVASSLGDDSVEQANRLVARMMFDPELAQHLLTRKIADPAAPAWNRQLQKIIRRTEAVKELQDDDEEK
jgi:hypothetical protein